MATKEYSLEKETSLARLIGSFSWWLLVGRHKHTLIVLIHIAQAVVISRKLQNQNATAVRNTTVGGSILFRVTIWAKPHIVT